MSDTESPDDVRNRCSQRVLQCLNATNDGQLEFAACQVHGQFGPWIGMQSELFITGKDHPTNLLPLGNDLVIGLEVEVDINKFTRD